MDRSGAQPEFTEAGDAAAAKKSNAKLANPTGPECRPYPANRPYGTKANLLRLRN